MKLYAGSMTLLSVSLFLSRIMFISIVDEKVADDHIELSLRTKLPSLFQDVSALKAEHAKAQTVLDERASVISNLVSEGGELKLTNARLIEENNRLGTQSIRLQEERDSIKKDFDLLNYEHGNILQQTDILRGIADERAVELSHVNSKYAELDDAIRRSLMLNDTHIDTIEQAIQVRLVQIEESIRNQNQRSIEKLELQLVESEQARDYLRMQVELIKRQETEQHPNEPSLNPVEMNEETAEEVEKMPKSPEEDRREIERLQSEVTELKMGIKRLKDANVDLETKLNSKGGSSRSSLSLDSKDGASLKHNVVSSRSSFTIFKKRKDSNSHPGSQEDSHDESKPSQAFNRKDELTINGLVRECQERRKIEEELRLTITELEQKIEILETKSLSSSSSETSSSSEAEDDNVDPIVQADSRKSISSEAKYSFKTAASQIIPEESRLTRDLPPLPSEFITPNNTAWQPDLEFDKIYELARTRSSETTFSAHAEIARLRKQIVELREIIMELRESAEKDRKKLLEEMSIYIKDIQELSGQNQYYRDRLAAASTSRVPKLRKDTRLIYPNDPDILVKELEMMRQKNREMASRLDTLVENERYLLLQLNDRPGGPAAPPSSQEGFLRREVTVPNVNRGSLDIPSRSDTTATKPKRKGILSFMGR